MAGIFDVKENVALKDKNTFHVAATTRWYGEFSSADDLKAFYDDPRFRALPKFILGGGSNLLITQDFDGLMLKSVDTSVSVVDENDAYTFVKIGAGADWTATVASLVDKGFNGIENLMSVPGTVGGAAVQNIGAYGLEIAERISEVECFDPAAGDVCVLSADDCDYGYRTSIFKTEKTDWVVLSVTLALPKVFEPRVAYKELAAVFGDKVPASAKEVASAVKAVRAKKLPDPAKIGNAGSFFKNPVVTKVKMVNLLEDDPTLVTYPLAGGRAKLSAGRLIDAVGLKGKREGDAGVSEKHSLVLVNYGNATGKDILAMAEKVKAAVKRRYGVTLEPEPVIL